MIDLFVHPNPLTWPGVLGRAKPGRALLKFFEPEMFPYMVIPLATRNLGLQVPHIFFAPLAAPRSFLRLLTLSTNFEWFDI